MGLYKSTILPHMFGGFSSAVFNDLFGVRRLSILVHFHDKRLYRSLVA
jgi:hypothetical protein